MRLLRYVGLGMLVLLGGCSRKETKSKDHGANSNHCRQASKTICEGAMKRKSPFLETQFGTVARCVERFAMLCAMEVDAPGVKSKQCRKKLPSLAKTVRKQAADKGNFPNSFCQGAGTKASGKPCRFDSQCASSKCTAHSALGRIAGGCGVCYEPARKQQSCSGDITCADGLFCDQENSLCQQARKNGESCQFGQCGQGLSCANDRCVPVSRKVGQPCSPIGVTGPMCDINLELTCNSKTNKCQHPVLIAHGQQCDPMDLSKLCRHGVCAGKKKGEFRCVKMPQEGDRCAGAFEQCALPAECRGGKCEIPAKICESASL